MKISFLKEEKIYVADIRFEQRELLKKAGWRWSYVRKQWYTTDRKQVEPFKAFLDTSAREQEKIWHEKIGKNVELSKKLELEEDVTLLTPKGLSYDPYQKVAIIYSNSKNNNILIADPPGLGKTIEAIGIVNNSPFPVLKVLIICEASHKIHWKREWVKWNTNPALTCSISETIKEKYKDAEGKTKYRSVPNWTDDPVVIINYHQVKIFDEKLKSIKWDYIIVDEAQAITNPEAEITKQILGTVLWSKKEKRKPIPAKKKLFLTGTPMLGKPKKLFVFCRECDPNGLGKNYIDFADRYCNGHMTDFGYDDNGANESLLPELQEKMRANFMIRRSKQEALKDLPDKRRYPFILPKDGLTKIVERENNAFNTVKKALEEYEISLGLRQTSSPDRANEVLNNLYSELEERFGDPSGFSFDEIVKNYSPAVLEAFEELALARKELAIAKLPMVKKISQEVIDSGNKLIMFCIHADVAAALRDLWPGCCFVTGKVPPNKRQAEIDRFQTDPECMVAVGNIHAMGKGYTMTEAMHVDFAEMSLVADHMVQAEDRAWRRGQKNAVTARYFVVEDTYDARNAEIFVEKLELNRKALDD